MSGQYIFGAEKQERARSFIDDPNLPAELKLHLANIEYPKIIKEQKKLRAELSDIESRIKNRKIRIEILETVQAWTQLPEHALEANECSRVHKLADAIKNDRWLCRFELGTEKPTRNPSALFGAKSFVVQNDWHSAFKNAEEFSEGDFKLPYETCAFEFKISGRVVILLASQTESGFMHLVDFIQCGDYWVTSDNSGIIPKTLMGQQMRALCIALEAEVAKKEVVRADYKLNKERIKRGELPLFDYHIVSLAKRARVDGLGIGSHRSPRLHFRRGHWRHFETHKTWIKWMLVGNPDLGFIGKEYRL